MKILMTNYNNIASPALALVIVTISHKGVLCLIHPAVLLCGGPGGASPWVTAYHVQLPSVCAHLAPTKLHSSRLCLVNHLLGGS